MVAKKSREQPRARAGGTTALNRFTPRAPMTMTPYMISVPPNASQAKLVGSASFLERESEI